MNVLVYGIVLFLVAFFIHLLFWKFYLPKHHTKALLKIFIATLLGGIVLAWAMPRGLASSYMPLPRSGYEYLRLSLFFISLALGYIATYSAVEVDSPSLVMILAIAKAGKAGLPQADLFKSMTDDLLVKPRLRDLVDDNMVCLDNDKYKLAPKGIFFIRTIILSRKVLRASKGG